MNKVILMGRLTKDPELKQVNEHQNCRFGIAVNRRFDKENKADFINCIAWNKTAEFITKYFQKGSMIAFVGSLRTDSYTKEDGTKRYNVEVNVEEAYFTGSKSESAQGGTINVDNDFFVDLDAEGDLPF